MPKFVSVALSLTCIITGLAYPTVADSTIPSNIIAIVGVNGFIVFCVTLSVCGVGMLLKPRYMTIWLSPAILVILATLRMAILGQGATALLFYTPLIVFTYYIEYRTHHLLHYVTARRLMIPLYAGMVASLFTHPNSSGMPLLYSALDFLLNGIVNPVSFYRFLYIAGLVGLLIVELTTWLPRGRLTTQILTLPFMSHGFVFAGVALLLGTVAFIPMLMTIPLLWWAITLEYDYE